MKLPKFPHLVSKLNALILRYEYVGTRNGINEYCATPKTPLDNYSAYVLDNSIFYASREDYDDPRVFKHEMSHMEDINKLGWLLHRLIYGTFNMVYGYYSNPLEVKARMAEEE